MQASAHITLASSSRRRREIIRAFDARVRVAPADIRERDALPDECAEDYVVDMARLKARRVAAKQPADTLTIGADTTVVLDGRALGKPQGIGEARAMLRELRGREHRVVTGVAIAMGGRETSSATSSQVVMRAYSDREIADYVQSGEPFDKAGGYAIQDAVFAPVSALRGCYLNVVGLPVCGMMRLARLVGAELPLRADAVRPRRCPASCPIPAPREGVET